MSGETLIIGNGNFAAKTSKLLGYTIDSNNLYKPVEMDFSRSTTATYIGDNGIITTAAANIARVQDNALLLEPARTNLFTNSENLAGGAWQSPVNNTISTNVLTAPDGATTADIAYETAVNSNHFVWFDITITSGASYTISIFAKSVGGRNIRLTGSLGLSGSITVDLSNGSILSGTGIVQSYTNGWYRISVTSTSTTTTGRAIIYTVDGTSVSYLGDVTKGVSVWGAQLEAGAYPTSYIPTTTTSVTRTPDSFSKTGISSLIGQTEGTIFFDYIAGAAVADDLISFNRVTTNTVVLTQFSSGAIRIVIYYGSSFFQILSSVTVVAGSRYKIALRYKSGDTKIYINGSSVGSSTTAFAFTGSLSEINVNKSSAYFAGVQTNQVKAIAIYPTGLSDSELAALTT